MIGKNLTSLANAIAEYEGWSPDSATSGPTKNGSLSYRNHNPGNLRSSIFQIGERNGFAYFYNDQTGFFALTYDLMQKAKGNTRTGLGPKSTIEDLMNIYAPKIENNTEQYIQFIELKTGLKRTDTLDKLLLI
jgi:hypothetical protein